MFVDTEQFAADLAAMDEAKRERAYAAGFGSGSPIITTRSATTPTSCRRTPPPPCHWTAANRWVTGGPFVEGKEVVSGYAEIEAADLDEALWRAKSWSPCR